VRTDTQGEAADNLELEWLPLLPRDPMPLPRTSATGTMWDPTLIPAPPLRGAVAAAIETLYHSLNTLNTP